MEKDYFPLKWAARGLFITQTTPLACTNSQFWVQNEKRELAFIEDYVPDISRHSACNLHGPLKQELCLPFPNEETETEKWRNLPRASLLVRAEVKIKQVSATPALLPVHRAGQGEQQLPPRGQLSAVQVQCWDVYFRKSFWLLPTTQQLHS